MTTPPRQLGGTILVTGGCGFIGSNFVRLVLAECPDANVLNVDALTYAGNLESLRDVEGDARYAFIKADIADSDAMSAVFEREEISAIVNFAAESHVDRSILSAADFIRTNIAGTHVLLEASLARGKPLFVQVSTDEVYGALGEEGFFTETTQLAPNSPYSASKASADLLVRAYHETHGLATVITRCSNNYGPYQFPEKLIPLFLSNAMDDKPLPVYGDGLYVRDWIHVEDHCRAVLAALTKAPAGSVYNVGARTEVANIDLTKKILEILGKPDTLIHYVKDRPGHDRRYAIDSTKIETELGWNPRIPFDAGLRDTVQWYLDHRPWWEHIKSGEYLKYYDEQYGKRLSS